ncbi:MAG: hypothetical protein D8M59_01095 [Planctomycetes bacterium]|nr:hypothetical protein [Planctomycetota bacterium]NOG54682.1 hypothetical protein [Planctomycetota bacterium]
MGGDTIRELGSFGLIAAAVTVGGVVQFLFPKMSELQTTQAQIQQINADEGANAGPSADVQARADHIRDRVRMVNELNHKTGDTRVLYQLLLQLAESHGVEYESIQPQEQSKAEPNSKQVRTTAFRLAWVSDLPSTGHMLEDLDACGIPHRVANLHLLPIKQDDITVVSVSMQVEFLHYPIVPMLAAMAELNESGEPGNDPMPPAATGQGGGI